MMDNKHISEIISARKADEGTFYLYDGIIYAYGKIKRLKYKERFRRICKAENYEVKLKDDFDAGMKLMIIE